MYLEYNNDTNVVYVKHPQIQPYKVSWFGVGHVLELIKRDENFAERVREALQGPCPDCNATPTTLTVTVDGNLIRGVEFNGEVHVKSGTWRFDRCVFRGAPRYVVRADGTVTSITNSKFEDRPHPNDRARQDNHDG